MGHVARDVAIVEALRKLIGGVEVEWCSSEPASSYLVSRGERLLPLCRGLETLTGIVEDLYNLGFRGSGGLKRLRESLEVLKKNWKIVGKLVSSKAYDVVVADEFWEIVYNATPSVKRGVVFLTDIVYMPYTLWLPGMLVSLAVNRYFRKALLGFKKLVYLNSPRELGSAKWLLFFGGRVAGWLRENAVIAGYAPSFLPGTLPERGEARRLLGVGQDEYLVVVSVGGTSTRSIKLLNCIDNSFHILSGVVERVLGRRLVVAYILGPRTRWTPSRKGESKVYGLVPDMRAFYAAADLFITRAGRTTTADLLCSGRNAVLVPIAHHMEQEHIAQAMNKLYGYQVVKENKCRPKHIAKAMEKALTSQPLTPSGEECKGPWIAAKTIIEAIS